MQLNRFHLPITLSSALEYTSPYLFPATHWYIPISASARRVMDRAPLMTCTLSCGKQDISVKRLLLRLLICIKAQRVWEGKLCLEVDGNDHKSECSLLMGDSAQGGCSKTTAINLYVYEMEIKPWLVYFLTRAQASVFRGQAVGRLDDVCHYKQAGLIF